MAENRNAQQVREITDKLEQGLKELFESERFKEYLKTMSKFYNYSFNIRFHRHAEARCDADRRLHGMAAQLRRHVMKAKRVSKSLLLRPTRCRKSGKNSTQQRRSPFSTRTASRSLRRLK
jgi:hypothetical protein